MPVDIQSLQEVHREGVFRVRGRMDDHKEATGAGQVLAVGEAVCVPSDVPVREAEGSAAGALEYSARLKQRFQSL